MKTTVILRRILLAAALCLLANLSSFAYDFEDAGFYYNILDADAKTVEVTFPSNDTPDDKRYSGDIIIPAEATYNNEKYNVTQIGWQAFSMNSGINKVIIPSTINSIKGSAFSYCHNLKEAIIEEGIKELGDSMFYDSDPLESVQLPSTLKSVGSSAFCFCEFTSIKLPEGLTKIGDSAFDNCRNLKGLDLPSTVREIGLEAFSGCGLEKVDIPEGVTELRELTFSECYNLASVKLPESLIEIGRQVFSFCYKLESIDIPTNVKTIGQTAFFFCRALKDVYLPEGLETIRWSAFGACESLSSIVIPHTVKNIGPWAFYYCTALKSVEIGSGIQSVGGGCFMGCDALESMTVHALEPPVAREIPEETPEINIDTATESDFDKLGTFDTSHYENVALTVPVNSIPKYKDADKVYGTPVWPNFKYFTNEILTGVDSVAAEGDGNSEVVARYDLSGRPVADDYRGLTIVRRADGTVAKEIRR